MAAGAHAIQLTVTEKIPLRNGRAIYFGTAEGGSEYSTGGVEVEEEATNSRYPLPKRFDMLAISAAGLVSQFVSPNKLKLFAEQTVGTSTETALAQYKANASMATAVPAGTPFWGIGLA
jgi:hypothetical protein